MIRLVALALSAATLATAAFAEVMPRGIGSFANIDGGTLDMDDWRGRPILLVNTASQCGFTPQYNGLQDLYDTYRDAGLVVLAVPSDAFDQELSTNAEVAEFCNLHYATDLPMAEITTILGQDAHPLYAWLRDSAGFTPRWNFNKVLIGRNGAVRATYGSTVRPMSKTLRRDVEAELLNEDT
ncbi:MAG: glutathione peroxidase [Pseudomonadota bacterium]